MLDLMDLDALLGAIAEQLEPPAPVDWACWTMRGGGKYPVLPGTQILVHRFVYILVNGPISDDLVVDHDCHNRDPRCPGGKGCRHRRCIRPDHLIGRTTGENTRRGRVERLRLPAALLTPSSTVSPDDVAVLRAAVAAVADFGDDDLVPTGLIAERLGDGSQRARALLGLTLRRLGVAPLREAVVLPDGTRRRCFQAGDIRAAEAMHWQPVRPH